MTQTISKFSGLHYAMMILALMFFAAGTMNTASAMTQSEGTWVNKQYKIKGAWEIENRDGQTVIKFKDGFKTKGGPDLKVFLSRKDIKDVNGKNATTESV
ncbi:MAG: hypothetical protein AAF404_18200, partial [Pseudomonadota bacterium]